ncbi:MAG: hypothetical protein ACK4JE_04820 [Endomicrobiia bacterium]
MRYYILTIAFVSMFTTYGLTQQNSVIDAELKYDWLTHKLLSGWSVTDKGLNKEFSFSQSVSTSAGWNSFGGATLLVDLDLHPSENFSLLAGFKAISNYADRLWLPINDEHRLYNEKKYFRWMKCEAKYQTEYWYLKYFRGLAHYHWGYEGDMFNLYPEQVEPERYLRVSGRAVPEGFEGNIKSKLGNLTIVAGPEIRWGYKDSIYAKYNFRINRFDSAIIYKNEIIPYGEPNERLTATQLSTKFNVVRNISLQTGLLYQPFRLNREYQYVSEVHEGEGIAGSKYLLHKGITETKDAIATKFNLTTQPYPIVNEFSIEYTYCGLVAGNKQEILLKTSRPLAKYLTGAIEYKYCKPLLGPLPLVYEGTEENMGPAVINPRGPENPFWVNWLYTDWDNREQSIVSVVFTFDPTPATWFYKYQPNKLEEWNLNPEEDASLAFGLGYTISYYPTTTDRMYYYDEQGKVVWEPYYHTGAWATKSPVNTFTLLSKLKLYKWRILINISGGESLATRSLAYTTLTNKEKSMTTYFSCNLSLIHWPWSGKILYGQNVWGPEEWHRHFGETIDRLYNLSLSRTFGKNFALSLDYVGTREIDNKYYAPELGSFDEIKITVSLKFSSTVIF